jgi:hypothetical protein
VHAPVVVFADAVQELVEALEVQGLDEIVAGSKLDGLHGGVDGRIAGHQHHFARGETLANRAQYVETAHVGHAQVDDRQVDRDAPDQLEGLRAAGA